MDTLQNTYKDDGDDDGENLEQEPSQTMQTQIQTDPSTEPDSIQINPYTETITTQIKVGIALSNPNSTTKIEFESNPELMGNGSSENPTRNVSPALEDEQNPESNGGQDQIQTNPLIELDPIESDPSNESNSIQINGTIPTQFDNPKIEPDMLMAVESPENPTQDVSSGSISENEHHPENLTVKEEQDEETRDSPSKKQKSESNIDVDLQVGIETTPLSNGGTGSGKKYSKKKYKGNNVWTKSTSRKGKKKAKNLNGGRNGTDNVSVPKSEDTVLITPMPRFPDRNDDSPEANICLSKVYKAEKVELSEDRLIAGSCKGYRMVRATRGVSEGAWFFEIKVVSLGETGHTRLGWSTEKGDLQGPVGYDGNSFGYRDIDGSKIHKALREKYGEEGYNEGDVIGFYISLPEGDLYASKSPRWVWYKGQKYVCAPDPKEDPPKVIPGSEISFYKNGICQGIAFKDLFGGRYYPAASMYTLPNQPNCVVKFNFGPEFDCFPTDLEGRPVPKPMIEVPYHGFGHPVENGVLEEHNQ